MLALISTCLFCLQRFVLHRCNTRPNTRCSSLSKVLRVILALSVLLYTLCFFELVFCGTLALKAGADDPIFVWVVLGVGSVPFVAPLAFLVAYLRKYKFVPQLQPPTQLSERTASAAVTPSVTPSKKDQDAVENQPDTERGLIHEHEQIQEIQEITEERSPPQNNLVFEGGQQERLSIRTERLVRRVRAHRVAKDMLAHEDALVQDDTVVSYLLFFDRKVSAVALVFPALFLLRAGTFCVAVIVVERLAFQIYTALLSSLVLLCPVLLAHKRLWADGVTRWIFFATEAFILVVLYSEFVFSAHVQSLQLRSTVGWCLMGLALALIVINLGILAFQVVGAVKGRLRRHAARRRAVAKSTEEFEEGSDGEVSSCDSTGKIGSSRRNIPLNFRDRASSPTA